MKILVYESETIQAIVAALIKEHDPDFPSQDGKGVSTVVERALQELLTFAVTDDVDNDAINCNDHSAMVQLIRSDLNLMDVAELNWLHLRVEDNHGTMVLIF
jgi:hypothetical protein